MAQQYPNRSDLRNPVKKLAAKGKQIKVEAPRIMKEFQKLPIMKKVTKATSPAITGR